MDGRLVDVAEDDGAPASDEAVTGRALPCPRCGHDLRGECMQWTEACPLRGRCPECGLEFQWGAILGDHHRHPSWSLEGGRGPLVYAKRLGLSCAAVAVTPRRAFRSIAMHHTIRPGRLALAIALWVVLGTGIFVVDVANQLVNDWWQRVVDMTSEENARAHLWQARFQAMRSALVPWSADPAWMPATTPTRGTWIQTDLGWIDVLVEGLPAYFAAPEDIVVAKTQWGAYVLVPMDVSARPALTTLSVEEQAAYRAAFAEAVNTAQPLVEGTPHLAARSYISSMIPMATGSVAPDRVWALAGFRPPRRYAPVVADRMMRFHPWATLLVLGSVAMFAVLPIARRRAKVRWAHVVRIAVYLQLGAWTIATALWFVLPGNDLRSTVAWLTNFELARSMPSGLGLPPWTASLLVVAVVLGGVGLLLAAAWAWAARFYLRMERPWAIGLAVATPAVLVGCCAVYGMVLA